MARMMSNDKKVDIEYSIYCKQINNSNRTKTIKKMKIKAIQNQMLENYICDLFDYCHKVILIKNKCVLNTIKIESKFEYYINNETISNYKNTLNELIRNKNKWIIRDYKKWLFKNYKGIDKFNNKTAKEFYIKTNKYPYYII